MKEMIKRIISENSGRACFIIGNGMHLHFKSGIKSWNDLLMDIYNKYKKENDPIFDNVPVGVSLTEFFDFLGGTEENNNSIQKDLADNLNLYPGSNEVKLIVEKIRDLGAPILTTNIDLTLSKSINANLFHITDSKFTDFYPWSSYYSDKKINKPNDGFGIWHINGMANYHRSIKFGLTHYMGNVERARTMIYKGDDSLYAKDNQGQLTKVRGEWEGQNTWLNIFFNRTLIIFGLGLGKDEVFLRWLLIERFKYNRRYGVINKSYFVDKVSNMKEGQKFFLRNVGIELIDINDYKILYEDIWK